MRRRPTIGSASTWSSRTSRPGARRSRPGSGSGRRRIGAAQGSSSPSPALASLKSCVGCCARRTARYRSSAARLHRAPMRHAAKLTFRHTAPAVASVQARCPRDAPRPCQRACRAGSLRTGRWPCRPRCCGARRWHWRCWRMSSFNAPSARATTAPRSVAQITPQFSAGALKAAADDLEGSAAWRVVEDAKQAWAERLPVGASDRLAWLIELPQADLLELLALCTAMTVNALPGAGAAFDANALAAAVELDMADWWEPTPARYLNHVPKSQIMHRPRRSRPRADGRRCRGDEEGSARGVRVCAARWQAVAAAAAAQAIGVMQSAGRVEPARRFGIEKPCGC